MLNRVEFNRIPVHYYTTITVVEEVVDGSRVTPMLIQGQLHNTSSAACFQCAVESNSIADQNYKNSNLKPSYENQYLECPGVIPKGRSFRLNLVVLHQSVDTVQMD
jgi:hypothetical protein